ADGSQLEVVHRGLRNPQELAFDAYGNLFADDNNCDKGDSARLVFVIDGGDTGWNMAYQTLPEPYLVGPWPSEPMWHPAPARRRPPINRRFSCRPAARSAPALRASFTTAPTCWVPTTATISSWPTTPATAASRRSASCRKGRVLRSRHIAIF